MKKWEEYEKAAEKGPMPFFLKVFGLMIAMTVVILVVTIIFGWFGEAANVVQEEFGPRGGLQKYEWFLDQASSIEKMDQDIELFENRVQGIEEKYAQYGEPISWPPDIRITYNREIQMARDDLLAIVSQRNNLVKEYNAASEKFNWKPFETQLDAPRRSFQEYRSN